jgi:hypothetical protein
MTGCSFFLAAIYFVERAGSCHETRARLSERQISKISVLGKGTVRRFLKRAEAAGLSWPLPLSLDDAAWVFAPEAKHGRLRFQEITSPRWDHPAPPTEGESRRNRQAKPELGLEPFTVTFPLVTRS